MYLFNRHDSEMCFAIKHLRHNISVLSGFNIGRIRLIRDINILAN